MTIDHSPTKAEVHTEVDGPLVPGLDPADVVRPAPRELDFASKVLYRRLSEVLDEAKELLAEADEIRDALRQLGRGRYTIDGEPVLDVIPTRRWSERRAREVLPPAVVTQLEVVIIDRALAHEKLQPPWYSACQEESGKDSVRRVRREQP